MMVNMLITLLLIGLHMSEEAYNDSGYTNMAVRSSSIVDNGGL